MATAAPVSRLPSAAPLAALGLAVALAAGGFLVAGARPSRRAGGADRVPTVAAVTPRTVAQLQTHLRSAPDDWQGWAALALGYVEDARVTGDPSLYPKADGALDRSLRLRPEGNTAALVGRAALANARHDFAGGLRFADEAAAADPKHPLVGATRGDALVELGRYDEAFAAYQRNVDAAPGLSAYTRAAYALELQGDLPGAERTLQLALGEAIAPKDVAFANFSLGELAWNRGDLPAARRYYEEAVRNDGSAIGPLAGLARLDAAGGHTGAAIDEWRAVTARSPLPGYVDELANLYLASGQPARAQEQFDLLGAQRALLAANGVNGDLEFALFSADHRIDLDRGLVAAEAEWTRRASIHVADAYAWQLHAHGRDAEALALADRALHLGTRNALFLFHRGMIHRSLGHTVAARADLRQALAINPFFSVLHCPTARATLATLDGMPR